MIELKKGAPVPDHWINKKTAAKSLGISITAFNKWEVQPIGKDGRSVYFTIKDIVANRRAHDEEKHKPEELDLEEQGSGIEFERLRLTRAQADAQELKNDELKAVLIPAEFQAFALSRLSAEISGILDSIPLDLKRKHPEITTLQIENLKRAIAKGTSACARLDERIEDLVEEFIKESDQ